MKDESYYDFIRAIKGFFKETDLTDAYVDHFIMTPDGEKHKVVDLLKELEEYEDRVEDFLDDLGEDLEPTTHCCECTPGDHYERHMVHIQYPDCTCESRNYILKKKEFSIVWVHYMGIDGSPSYYAREKVHPWCAELGIKEGKFGRENPRLVKLEKFKKKITQAKKDYKIKQ